MAGIFGDLFAPAYNPTDPTSVSNQQAWQKNMFSMTNPRVEETRSNVPPNPNEPRGTVDPEALRVLAQGGPYDMNARRNSVASAIQAQQAAAAPTASAPGISWQGRSGLQMIDPDNPGWGLYDPNNIDVSSLRGDAMNPTQGYGGGGVGGAY